MFILGNLRGTKTRSLHVVVLLSLETPNRCPNHTVNVRMCIGNTPAQDGSMSDRKHKCFQTFLLWELAHRQQSRGL